MLIKINQGALCLQPGTDSYRVVKPIYCCICNKNWATRYADIHEKGYINSLLNRLSKQEDGSFMACCSTECYDKLKALYKVAPIL